MIIIIDGYNMMKQADSDRHIGEQERQRFIQRLSRYGRRKKHTMVVIFDGGPQTWPSKELINGVKVVFSGVNETADELIMQYIKDCRTKELLLVSSDNELARFASTHEIISIGVHDFDYLMREALTAASDKRGDIARESEIELDDTVHDLDALMEAGSEIIPHKQEDQSDNTQRIATLQRISKKDRALLKKLNKL